MGWVSSYHKYFFFFFLTFYEQSPEHHTSLNTVPCKKSWAHQLRKGQVCSVFIFKVFKVCPKPPLPFPLHSWHTSHIHDIAGALRIKLAFLSWALSTFTRVFLHRLSCGIWPCTYKQMHFSVTKNQSFWKNSPQGKDFKRTRVFLDWPFCLMTSFVQVSV